MAIDKYEWKKVDELGKKWGLWTKTVEPEFSEAMPKATDNLFSRIDGRNTRFALIATACFVLVTAAEIIRRSL